MELVNKSPFDALFQSVNWRDSGKRAVVIVKATFDLGRDGTLVPSEDPAPIVKEYLETRFGFFHSEIYYRKQGADVCFLGILRRQNPVQTAEVRMTVGSRSWGLSVYGDRKWRSSGNGLLPSSPEPFTEMPIGYTRAFGGSPAYHENPVPYPDNPIGQGYYLKEEDAVGNKLPNIEDSASPRLRQWAPLHKVAGWGPYPNFWGLRATANVEIDAEHNVLKKIHPGLFNHAHPDLVVDELKPGDRVSVEGVSQDAIQFRLPDPPAQVVLRIGKNVKNVAAPMDGLFIWGDEGKVVITQRARFAYELRSEEIRTVAVSYRKSGGEE